MEADNAVILVSSSNVINQNNVVKSVLLLREIMLCIKQIFCTQSSHLH